MTLNKRHFENRTKEWWTATTRNFLLFVGGFLGVAYETIVEQVDRPALLAVFAGMLGLPAFLSKDERDHETPPSSTEQDGTESK